MFPHDGTTYEELLADADQLMYRDKAARRQHASPPLAVDPPDFIAAGIFDPNVHGRPAVPLPQTLA